MTNPTNELTVPTSNRTSNRTGALVRAGIVLAGALGAGLTQLIAGGHPRVDQNGTVQAVGVGAVLVTAVLAGLAGWALLAILERNVSRPRLVWTVIASVVAVLSLVGPAASAVDGHSRGTLVALHVVVAAVLIPALAAVARPRAKQG